MKRLIMLWLFVGAVAAVGLAGSVQHAGACTRSVYFGKDGQTVTGRTMDWVEDMQSNLCGSSHAG